MKVINLTSNIILKYAALICFILSFSIFTEVGYLQLKASLAQVLLTKAWHETNQTPKSNQNSMIKPWPWADFYPIAQITIPKLNLQQIVLNNDSGQALAFGPGLSGLSKFNNNIMVISGHNDSHFRSLQTLEIGDTITVMTKNQQQVNYKINRLSIIDINKQGIFIDEEYNGSLAKHNKELILVTCYPFESLMARTPFRLIIQAIQYDQ